MRYGAAMFGFGVKTSQVFTSRWKALLWAAGIMLTAYCTVPAADDETAAPPSGLSDGADPSGLTKQQKDDVDAALRAISDLNKNQ